MVRSYVAVAILAALLCVSVAYAESSAEEPEERGALGCKLTIQNIGNRVKDILRQVKQIAEIVPKTEKRVVDCVKLKIPNLVGTCMVNTGKDDARKVKDADKQIEQQAKQLEQQVEKLGQQCGGGGK